MTATPTTTHQDTANAEPVAPLPLPTPTSTAALAQVQTNPAMQPTQALDSYRFALEPTTFTDAYKLASVVAKSKLYGIETAEDALVRLMTGRSLGLPAAVSFQHIYVVYGRPGLSARLKMSLTIRHPECEKFLYVESDAKHATYIIKRRGQPERTFTYTIEHAQLAGVVKKDSAWMTVPTRMLEARASSWASDVIFPEACMGMPTIEEAIDMGQADGQPVDTRPVAQGAPRRDFDAECQVLKARITAAQTKEDKRAVHADVATFSQEAGEPWATECKNLWNLVHGPKKEAGTGQQTLA